MEMKGIYNANGIETTHIGTSQHPDSLPASRWLMVCPDNPDNKLHVLTIDSHMRWDVSQPLPGCPDSVLL